MIKAITLAGLLGLCCMTGANAWIPAPTQTPGPFPEPGTFCAPFKPCPAEVVTRGEG